MIETRVRSYSVIDGKPIAVAGFTFIAGNLPSAAKSLSFVIERLREGNFSSLPSAIALLLIGLVAVFVTASGVLNALRPEIESSGGNRLLRALSFPARLLPIRLEAPKDRDPSPHHEQVALTAHTAPHAASLVGCVALGTIAAVAGQFGIVLAMGILIACSLYFFVTPHRWLSFWMPIADPRGVDVPKLFGGSRFWDWSRTDLTVLGEQYRVALVRLDDTETSERRYIWICSYHLGELLGVRRAWEERASAPASA